MQAAIFAAPATLVAIDDMSCTPAATGTPYWSCPAPGRLRMCARAALQQSLYSPPQARALMYLPEIPFTVITLSALMPHSGVDTLRPCYTLISTCLHTRAPCHVMSHLSPCLTHSNSGSLVASRTYTAAEPKLASATRPSTRGHECVLSRIAPTIQTATEPDSEAHAFVAPNRTGAHRLAMSWWLLAKPAPAVGRI